MAHWLRNIWLAIVFCGLAFAQSYSQDAADTVTPHALRPGSPAGSYDLESWESVNLYNQQTFSATPGGVNEANRGPAYDGHVRFHHAILLRHGAQAVVTTESLWRVCMANDIDFRFAWRYSGV